MNYLTRTQVGYSAAPTLGNESHNPVPAFVGRTEVCSGIFSALTAGAPDGAVILGEPGIGKSALAQHMAGKLSDTAHIVHLRGSLFGSTVPYGALSILLADLDEDLLNHPVQLLHGITRVLREQAGDREIIMVVDNANYLDSSSVMIIGQLMVHHTVRVLAVCRDLSTAPDYVAALCRAKSLVRFDLMPMTQEDAGLLVAAELGHPLSREAVRALCRHSGGNPRCLRLLSQDYAASGTLELRHDVWVVTPRPITMRQHTRDVICEPLSVLTAAQRDIVDLVAAAGSVRWADLEPLVDATDLDDLQERGILSLRPDYPLTVSLTSPLLAEAVRGGTPESRRAILLGRIPKPAPSAAPKSALLTPDQRIRPHAPEQGRRQPAEPRLAQARLASSQGRYGDVIKLLNLKDLELGDLPPESNTLATALLCEALAMTGRPNDALELADRAESQLDVADEVTTPAAQCLSNAHLAMWAWTGVPDCSPQACTRPGNAGGTMEELADGLQLAFGGKAREALAFLVPALRQLEVDDPDGMASVAAAAAAYCLALTDDPADADFSSLARVHSADSTWLSSRLTRYFLALACGLSGSAEDAAKELLALSKEAKTMGNATLELLSLSSALRLGDRSLTDQVLAVSTSCQGAFARLCELYAKGLDNSDEQMMLQTMELAHELGNLLFAEDAAAAARTFAGATGRRGAIRHVRRRVTATLAGGADPETGYTPTQLEGLTAREEEVTQRVVAGKNNRRIAQELNVSVRTVEGHLYQVYAKLHVHSRRELAGMFTAELHTTQ